MTLGPDCTVWAKPSRPMDVRVMYSLMFGTKNNMKQYYPNSLLWADIDKNNKNGGLWRGDEKVICAEVEKRLNIN